MSRYSPTERIAVNAVEQIVISNLHWIFREQPLLDFGIDGHIEICKDGDPQNKLIAIQIKGGSSYLVETLDGKGSFYTFYISTVHYYYWINSSIPVIGVFRNDEGTLYWQKLDKTTIEKTSNAYKVKIPLINLFDENCLSDLLLYQQEWIPTNDFPFLESKYKSFLGIENYLIAVQSLRVLKDSINYHILNYKNSKAEIKASIDDNLNDCEFGDHVELQKIKLSARILNVRIRTELEYLSRTSSELFRAYSHKIMVLNNQFSKGEIDKTKINKEVHLVEKAERIVVSMIDTIIIDLENEAIQNALHNALNSDYKSLNDLSEQLNKELIIVKGFYKLISISMARILSQTINSV